MTVCGVDRCDRPAMHGAAVCAVCRVQLSDALAKIPDLAAELEVTATRQAKLNPGGGSGGESPLVFAEDAADLLWVQRNTLVEWVKVVAAEASLPHPLWRAEACALWLSRHLPAVLSSPHVVELLEEVLALARWCERAVDRPADRLFIGPCESLTCQVLPKPGELYAAPDAPTVQCRECGAEYDVAERRAWLLVVAADQLLPAVDLSRALTSLGAEVTPDSIRQWKARGRLIPHGHDNTPRRRPLYRVGDVLTLLGTLQNTLAKTLA